MLAGILNSTVTIKRRASTGRDALNNPTYGAPTSGSGWSTVYTNMPVRLAFSTKIVNFAKEGERIQPQGVMYFGTNYTIQQEDRVLTSDNREYVVTGLATGYLIGTVVDHFEANLSLP